MPCIDYESNSRNDYDSPSISDYSKLKKQADRLASIACATLTAMEAGESYDTLMKNKAVSTWWTAHKKADAAAAAVLSKAKEQKDAAIRLKEQALAKLTPEELAAFGLIKKGKK